MLTLVARATAGPFVLHELDGALLVSAGPTLVRASNGELSELSLEVHAPAEMEDRVEKASVQRIGGVWPDQVWAEMIVGLGLLGPSSSTLGLPTPTPAVAHLEAGRWVRQPHVRRVFPWVGAALLERGDGGGLFWAGNDGPLPTLPEEANERFDQLPLRDAHVTGYGAIVGSRRRPKEWWWRFRPGRTDAEVLRLPFELGQHGQVCFAARDPRVLFAAGRWGAHSPFVLRADEAWTQITPPPNERVPAAIAVARDGALWTVTLPVGSGAFLPALARLAESGEWEPVPLPAVGDSVLSMALATDEQGALWVVAQTHGAAGGSFLFHAP